MRRCLLITALASTLTAAAGAAQAGTLWVRVLDRAGEPVAGAAVIVQSLAQPGPAKPLAPVEIVQQDMKFVPAVAVVTPGTVVRFTNRDSFDHHVRGTGGMTFEYRIGGTDTLKDAARRDSKDSKAAAQVVLQGGTGPVTVGCYLHSRMAGNIYVSDSPYFGVSDADGRARIDVPDGAVTVVAWHPQQLVEQPAQAAQVAAGTQGLDVALNFTPRRRR